MTTSLHWFLNTYSYTGTRVNLTAITNPGSSQYFSATYFVNFCKIYCHSPLQNHLQKSVFTASSNYLSGVYCLWDQQHFFWCLFLFCCNDCSFTDCSPRKYWWKDSGNDLFLLIVYTDEFNNLWG